MPDALSEFTNPVGERKRLAEVLEPLLLLQVVDFNHHPPAAEPLEEVRQLRFGLRWDAPLQGLHSKRASSPVEVLSERALCSRGVAEAPRGFAAQATVVTQPRAGSGRIYHNGPQITD